MRRAFTITVLLALSLALSAQPQGARADVNPVAEGEIKALELKLAELIVHADWDEYEKHLASDYPHTRDNGHVENKDDALASLRDVKRKIIVMEMEPADLAIRIYGEPDGVNHFISIAELRVFGQFARIAPPLNPGEFDFAAHARGDGRLIRIRSSVPECVSMLEQGAKWSIARWMRIGIVVEISVYASEQLSANTPRCHCSRQRRSSLRKVGSRPRSGGSTAFMYVDMAKRPSQRAPSPERRAKSTIPARLRAAALAAFPDSLGGLRASAARLRARGRLEIGLARRLRQRRRRRRLAIRLGLSRRFGLG